VPALAGVVARAAEALGWERFDLAAHGIGGGVAPAPGRHHRSGRTDGDHERRDARLLAGPGGRALPRPLGAGRHDRRRPCRGPPRRHPQGGGPTAVRRRGRRLRLALARPGPRPGVDRHGRGRRCPVHPSLGPGTGRGCRPDPPGLGPRRLVQKIEYAKCYVQTVPGSDLVEVAGLHIATEDSAADVVRAVLEHLTG